MRIAYIVPYVPNLIRTRPYNLLTGLAAQGHEVVVFTLGSGPQDHADVNALRQMGIEVHFQEMPVWRSLLNSGITLPSRQPLQTVYSWHPGMARQLTEVLSIKDSRKKFDVVHVEHLRGSRYGTFLKSRFPDLPVVWDSVDSISHLFRQASSHSRSMFGKLVTRLELPRTEWAEGTLTTLFDHIVITSDTDKNALLELVPPGKSSAPISVLPNGVDLEYFQPNPSVERDPASIVFSGKMSYHANVSMVKYLVTEVMPKIWERRPTVCLTVVGKDPPAEIKALGENPLIKITGTVADIRPYLWRAAVAVVPLIYGAGIQNKILEAMATGTPVVTTTKALTSLMVNAGVEIFVGDSPDEFSQKVLDLMDNPSAQRSVGEKGLSYVQQNHHWKTIVARLADIYMGSINRKMEMMAL
jgi:glycosyltransferase involved in cell wall biosynthesis